MNAKEAIAYALGSTQNMLEMYLSDLSDTDLVVRPVPGANHIAWQVGHLITSEVSLGKSIPNGSYPELPAGFTEQHAQDRAQNETKTGWGSRADYVALSKKVREATQANLHKLSDADLDKKTEGRMASFAPTLGALFLLVANHTMMHAGQFSVVRRRLGKPVLF